MLKGIHHVGISTTDIERSIQFYCHLLGMELVGETRIENKPRYDAIFKLKNVTGRTAMLKAGSLRIELWEFEHPRGEARESIPDVSDPGISHVGFDVDDIEQAYERLTAHGVHFHCAPQDFGTAKVIFGRDPDGNIFEMLQWRQPAEPPEASG